MVCYQNMMNELADIILENKLQYHDTIIIGNNSSGKSELLKTILFKTDFEKIGRASCRERVYRRV